MNLEFLGDCRDENLVNQLFGDVSAFACEVEDKGDNFIANTEEGKVQVKYNQKKDIHSFFLIS
jgi:hypothetical protein